MSSKATQLKILREIFMEEFEVKEAGERQASTLYEVTSIEGKKVPDGLTLLINFDDISKLRFAITPFYAPGCSDEIDKQRFRGNLNIFIMKKKKVLKHIKNSYDGKEFEDRENTYSLKAILASAEDDLK